MKTQTGMVTSQVRLQQWAEQIRECQNRPAGMKMELWCEQNGITKANYYYRVRRVREACLSAVQCQNSSFVELPIAPLPEHESLNNESKQSADTMAVLKTLNGTSIDILSNASQEFITSLIGAIANVK